MSFTQPDILKALSTVEDPDLKRDLVSLGMIKDVKVDSGKVSFTVVLTTPACPLKEKIRKDCEDAVIAVVGEDVDIDITITSTVTTTRDNTPLLPGVKNIRMNTILPAVRQKPITTRRQDLTIWRNPITLTWGPS